MRILHTADWHLGRQFEGHSLDHDHAAVLDQVFAAVQKVRPDALVVAGDIFDRDREYIVRRHPDRGKSRQR
jgi:DNA repair protein SbcD/Mre11